MTGQTTETSGWGIAQIFALAISVLFWRAAQRFVQYVYLCSRHRPEAVPLFSRHLVISPLSLYRFRKRPIPLLTDGCSHFLSSSYLPLWLAFEKGSLPFCEQWDWFWFLSLTQPQTSCVSLNRYLFLAGALFPHLLTLSLPSVLWMTCFMLTQFYETLFIYPEY